MTVPSSPEGLAGPSLSVVIPTFNRAAWLPEAIESLLGQLGPADEMIVVDDGSTDETPAVLARYGDRLRVIRTANGGLGAARNVGVAAATRDWIAFHDSDDVATSDRLAVQRAWLRRWPQADAVLGNGVHMDGVGVRVVPARLAGRYDGRRVDVRALFDGFPLYFQGALVRRAALLAAGGFDPALRVHTDLDCGYRLLDGAEAFFVDHPVFSYRWHGANITADRVAGRAELARILARILDEYPAIAHAIGRRRIRVRLARHYFRLARSFRAAGRLADAGVAIASARRLRPLHLAYRFSRLRGAIPGPGGPGSCGGRV